MNRKIKIRAVVLLFIVTLLANSSVFASGFSSRNEEVTDGDMVAEWLARPAGALGTVAGLATFLIGLPFSVTADNTEESYDTLVKEPFKYTFHRPLGHYQADGNY
ncbi:MAG: hypothetical protein QM504_01305 [Pseudomonadota bacterium]